MKQGILFWVNWEVIENWDSNMTRMPQWRESHCRTITSIRRKKKIQKDRTVRVTVTNPSRNVNHSSKVIWDRKIITRVHQVYQFHQNRLAGPYDGSLNLQRKTHSKGVDQENLIYVRWNRIKNHVYSRCDQ